MISQEIREKIKKYNGSSHHSFGEICGTLNIINDMSFTEEADLDFDLIDFFYGGKISMMIADMQIVSEHSGFDRGRRVRNARRRRLEAVKARKETQENE